MSSYRDWLFFLTAGLAVVFMIWVLFKFTRQLAGPERSARRADAESERLCIVQTAPPEGKRPTAEKS